MRVAVWFLFMVLVAAAAPDVAPVDDAEHARLMRSVPPSETEYWEDIPWETDLYAAAKKAQREGMLLFVWAMNGHPLGCT